MEEGKNPAQTTAGITSHPELAMPYLTDTMLDRLHEYGSEETVPPGTILFARGDREVDFFAIFDGRVEIIVQSKGEQDRLLVEVAAKQFTGELDLLNSNSVLTDGYVPVTTRLLRIRRSEFRRLMRAEADIANLIMQATIWRRIAKLADGASGVTLLGKADASETVLLQRFLTLNRYPHRLIDPSAEQAPSSPDWHLSPDALLPAVRFPDGRVIHTPTAAQLADELGIGSLPDTEFIYDVTVIGAGPAGLSAAVYAASEGLSTLVLEATASGGQAGASSRIENYLGFPTGISGYELAGRAEMQAQKFGAQLAVPHDVVAIDEGEGLHLLKLSDGKLVRSRSVVVATGASYRKLNITNYERFENKGIYYAATGLEADLCRERAVVVVGGGNSAGQATIFLSGIASHVHLIVRKKSLASTMSSYLISRIENSPLISLHTSTEIEHVDGNRTLEALTWVNTQTGERETRQAAGLFVMIGAEPNSGWLFGRLALDKRGFIATGAGHSKQLSRYATSVPGIFAVGDVRSGSVKRVASAVGEGSIVISDVHQYLLSRQEMIGANPDSTLAALRQASAIPS